MSGKHASTVASAITRFGAGRPPSEPEDEPTGQPCDAASLTARFARREVVADEGVGTVGHTSMGPEGAESTVGGGGGRILRMGMTDPSTDSPKRDEEDGGQGGR